MKHSVNTMATALDNVENVARKTSKRKKLPDETNMQLSKPYILATLELPLSDKGSFDLKTHERNCFNILNLIFETEVHGNANKTAIGNHHLWRFAKHYLVPEYPPFMRFLESPNDPSRVKYSSVEAENQVKRMRLTEELNNGKEFTSLYKGNENISDEEILQICLKFLDIDAEHFGRLWPWDRLFQMSLSFSEDVDSSKQALYKSGKDNVKKRYNWLTSNNMSHNSKWLAVECLGRLCPNLVEKKRAHLYSKLTVDKIKGMPVALHDYNVIAAEKISTNSHRPMLTASKSAKNSFQNRNIKGNEERIVQIQGEALLKKNTTVSFKDSKDENHQFSVGSTDPFVNIYSQKSDLIRIVRAVNEGKAVLIRGPIGCGKTRLIQYLADQTGHQKDSILQVHMSDQMDGRALIGGYSCKDVPGQFHWEDGVATKAAEGGKWLLVEDADQAFRNNAGSDGSIAGILMTLIERKQLHLPSRGTVINASTGFQLFLTQRVVGNGDSNGKHISMDDNLLSALARTKGLVEIITLQEHSETEIRMIAEKQPLFNINNPSLLGFGKMEGLALKMVACFIGLKERSNAISSEKMISVEAQKRTLSLRDFLKWCRRCLTSTEAGNNPLTPETIVLEGMDCFANHLPRNCREKRERVYGIGHMFGLLSNNIDHLLAHRTPTLTITPISISKRLRLPKDKQQINEDCRSVEVPCGHLIMGRSKLTILANINSVNILATTSRLTPFFLTPSASKLLEFITVAVQGNKQKHAEPVLLVGETGVGKTSAVQHLAGLVGRKLITVNLNQQTESSDLLGGYKPVDIEHFIKPVRAKFENLFAETFSSHDNAKFMSHLSMCYRNQRWEDLLKLMVHATRNAHNKCQEGNSSTQIEKWDNLQKRLDRLLKNVTKLKSDSDVGSLGNKLLFSFVNGVLAEAAKRGDWILLDEINMAEADVLECLSEVMNTETDSFVVSSSTGDTQDDVISKSPNFRVFACMNPATDVGKKQLPDGLRNRFTEYFIEEPSTKEELLPIVNDYLKRINEFSEETKNICERIVKFYFEIKRLAEKVLVDGTGHKPTFSLRTLCRAITVAVVNLTSSANGSVAPSKEHLKRYLLEGFLMCFLTELDHQSYPIVIDLIYKHIAGGKKKALSLLSNKLSRPEMKKHIQGFVSIEGFWISCGETGDEPYIDQSFILTPTVRQNLRDVARVVSLSKHAVLLQGETSVGKTSLISYLGDVTGNQVVRINNHEHTDIQEYVGAYAVDPKTGCFTFIEGILAKAMRNGHWVILDELNLAPSDVLEALNRVLDDNRELFIPETQTTIKASENFRIFATQNPSGKYGGRKSLSRAFRNRFIELHFGELPPHEVSEIIHRHCKIEPKASKKLVAVAREIKMSRVNTGGGGCDPNALLEKTLTLRDLFRWANRCFSFQQVTKYHNWDQHFAQEGYLVLASKIRRAEEKVHVQNVLEKVFKCKINPDSLFDLSINTKEYIQSGENAKHPIVTIDAIELIQDSLIKQKTPNQTEIIWTDSAVRLAVLIIHSLKFKEPVLMVGETGCGKTSITVMVAKLIDLAIRTVNCHLNSETSDFLGSLRPTRTSDKTEKSAPFEWVDGPLVEVMKHGGIFLVDEISLADDSVLERMNSVLEPSRSLTLVEGGSLETNLSQDNSDWYKIKAHETFQFIATMNPGGDFGKKELSPALRNRLVEIWCPSPMETPKDVNMICDQMLLPLPSYWLLKDDTRALLISTILSFLQWFQKSKSRLGDRCVFTVRDLVSLVSFINGFISLQCETFSRLECCLVHGICLVVFDGLASFIEARGNLDMIREEAKSYLQNHLSSINHSRTCDCFKWITYEGGDHIVEDSNHCIRVGNFEMRKQNAMSNTTGDINELKAQFSLATKTVACNMLKVLRGMQVSNKPILLEGTPGVGKTSSIIALSQITGNALVRINLSDQTEISDLFGSDLPTSNGPNGIASFSWQDGPFLSALKAGHWILLDELNLATQSVLEGLNAALDHRGEIYIPELNRTFSISNNGSVNKTRVFGCQNPPRDGGERKNLPKSFLNRFIKVYLNDYTSSDLVQICGHRFPKLTDNLQFNLLEKIVAYVTEIQLDLSGKGQDHWGAIGSPWQLNLRDILRWCLAISSEVHMSHINPSKTNGPLKNDEELDVSLFMKLRLAKLLFVERFRTKRDQTFAIEKLTNHFLPGKKKETQLEDLFSDPSCQNFFISYDNIQIGLGSDIRTNAHCEFSLHQDMRIHPNERSVMESLLFCTKYKWMPILVEDNQTGRAGKLVQNLAKLYGQPIRTIALNAGSDTSELLGGFEQTGNLEKLAKFYNKLLNQIDQDLDKCFQSGASGDMILSILSAKIFFKNQLFNFDLSDMWVRPSLEENANGNSWNPLNVLQIYVNNLRVNGFDCHLVTSLLDELLQNIPNKENEDTVAQFDWVESVLVNAMESGEWLLIEDANRCNPSVLDRLNGLLEENGKLEIGEKGCCENGNVSCSIYFENNMGTFIESRPPR